MRGHPIDLLDEVAGWLEEAGTDVVYTGGTVVPLHLGELARQEFRPTKDVDVVVKSLTYAEYSDIGRHLRSAGITESLRDGAPLCRYERDGIEVDVMPVDPPYSGSRTLNTQKAGRTERRYAFLVVAKSTCSQSNIY